MADSTCKNCGLPLATPEMDVIPGYCYVESSNGCEGFELECLRLAVRRLKRTQEAKVLRAQFAGQALQGLLADPEWNPDSPLEAAKVAVGFADALLVALGHEAPQVEEGRRG